MEPGRDPQAEDERRTLVLLVAMVVLIVVAGTALSIAYLVLTGGR